MRFSLKEDGKEIILVVIASAVMALNIKTFVRTGELYPGGATGLTILLQRCASMFLSLDIPYSALNIPLNLLPVYIGFRFIGRKFTLYSCLMIFLTSIFTDMIPAYAITYDSLLISIFGGLINGCAISCALFAGATSGGTDFISIYLSEKRGVESWNIILAFNTVILLTAGAIFGWDKALYSIIFQYVSTQTLHALYKTYQQETLLIITDKAQEIADVIHEVSHHGATILDATGSHGHTSKQMVYSVINRENVHQVISAVKALDGNAFINSIHTEQISGHFYRRPRS